MKAAFAVRQRQFVQGGGTPEGRSDLHLTVSIDNNFKYD